MAEANDVRGVFTWAEFYQVLADKLLTYKDNRSELMRLIE